MKQITHLGKMVGFLRPDKTFVTYRKPIHFFRMFNGFGISYAVLKKLREFNCHLICLVYNNSHNEESIYFSSPEKLLLNGTRYVDKSHDVQMILPLKDWSDSPSPPFPMELKN